MDEHMNTLKDIHSSLLLIARGINRMENKIDGMSEIIASMVKIMPDMLSELIIKASDNKSEIMSMKEDIEKDAIDHTLKKIILMALYGMKYKEWMEKYKDLNANEMIRLLPNTVINTTALKHAINNIYNENRQ